jgi:hypothetical protein
MPQVATDTGIARAPPSGTERGIRISVPADCRGVHVTSVGLVSMLLTAALRVTGLCRQRQNGRVPALGAQRRNRRHHRHDVSRKDRSPPGRVSRRAVWRTDVSKYDSVSTSRHQELDVAEQMLIRLIRHALCCYIGVKSEINHRPSTLSSVTRTA